MTVPPTTPANAGPPIESGAPTAQSPEPTKTVSQTHEPPAVAPDAPKPETTPPSGDTPKPDTATDTTPATTPDAADKQAQPDETVKPASPTPEAAADATPKKELSTQKNINKALEEMGKILKDNKDPRSGVVALARLAGDGNPTPLGNELRHDVISALQKDSLATESIKGITLADKPETNAVENFLDQSQLGKSAEGRLNLQELAKQMTVTELTDMARRYAPLRELYFNALLGENHPPLNTAEDVLKTLKAPNKPEPDKNPAVELAPAQPFMPNEKNKKTLGEFLQSSLSVGFAGIMVLQLGMALANESPQGGH